jgi:hypothetical protein
MTMTRFIRIPGSSLSTFDARGTRRKDGHDDLSNEGVDWPRSLGRLWATSPLSGTAMAKRVDVKREALDAWNHYNVLETDVACERIYQRASGASKASRDWYWDSIRSKRRASLVIRIVSFALVLAGAVLPVLSALRAQPESRLLLTQLGIIALAVAGLLQAGDKVFGWSSGWLRYVTTVTAMEAATRDFELAWAAHLLAKEGSLGSPDKRQLFEMAKKLEGDLMRLQSEETEKWVGEFNSSLGLLHDLIKSQRDSAESTAQAARAALEAKEGAATSRLAGSVTGGIEVTIKREVSAAPLVIRIDDAEPEEFAGSIWSCVGVKPGLRKVEIADAQRTVVMQRIASVAPGEIAKLDVSL